MRVWGRTYDALGNGKWVAVETDSNGFDDYPHITALVQAIRLNLNESPFWGQFGLPARQAILQQQPPDYNMQFIANYFSQFFASLVISRAPIAPPGGTFRTQQQNRPAGAQDAYDPTPTYFVQILRKDGSTFEATVAI